MDLLSFADLKNHQLNQSGKFFLQHNYLHILLSCHKLFSGNVVFERPLKTRENQIFYTLLVGCRNQILALNGVILVLN